MSFYSAIESLDSLLFPGLRDAVNNSTPSQLWDAYKGGLGLTFDLVTSPRQTIGKLARGQYPGLEGVGSSTAAHVIDTVSNLSPSSEERWVTTGRATSVKSRAYRGAGHRATTRHRRSARSRRRRRTTHRRRM